ncbi:MAG: hydrogenase iron-sulfur subunit [Candidatus Bathyarchaeota archaeon]|nr:hydrogenase iron-sulfur subunit [Candidatus Bathyarchaeum tardum]WNZ30071.1 MAG: hydrogenase iron-sulfur subunit [Candidatus Bathyarchaeota archaeon]
MTNEPSRTAGIEIADDFCSRCGVCVAVCPFEAISKDEEQNKIILDVEKCRVCGLCVSACPMSAIDLVYYNVDSMTKKVQDEMKEKDANTLVLSCRGSNAVTIDIKENFKDENVENFVSLRLPCVGRVPPEFYMNNLAAGTEKILVLQCEEDFCRFKKGSKVGLNRFELLKETVDVLGYDPNNLVVKTNSLKAVYDSDKCVGCGKCVFICPYDAIVWKDVSTPEIKTDDCMGCGACALVCPHQAIELRGYEFEPVSDIIKNCSSKAANAKAKGKSAILLFVCQWSEFSALDDVQNGCLTDNVTIIELPCAKGFDPVLVLEALSAGFDGVMAVICPEELCKLEEGTYLGERNFSALKVVLKEYNLDDRFESFRVSPKYPGDFKEKLEEFTKKISSIPDSEEKSA